MGDARKGGWCEGVCVGRALCVAHHERAGEGGGLHSGDGEHCWSVFASFCVMKPDADALSGKHPFLAARELAVCMTVCVVTSLLPNACDACGFASMCVLCLC